MVMELEEVFEINEKILKWSGFWPVDDGTKIYTIFNKIKRITFWSACFLIILHSQYLYIVNNQDKLAEISVVVSMIFSVLLQIAKFSVFMIYRKDLGKIVLEMRDQWRKCES